MGARPAMVGRQAERSRIANLLAGSAEGTPSALLVCGEAGVGKTRLVTEAVEEYAAQGHLVLWGRCLRFGADSSPYLPIGQLLTQWYRQADPAERARVLVGTAGLATIAPSLGTTDPGPATPGQLVGLASTVVDRIAERTPTVLVVDDLQWADSTSLDLLAYVVAGFTQGQRLAVLGTYRDTDLGEGHRLHGWLADLRRLPLVDQVRLDRLDLLETEQLVTQLCGAGQTPPWAADLFTRSGGNPYLAELLAQAATRTDGGEPGEEIRADGTLADALLSSWHRLTGPARELMQLLAVGGRPVALPVLESLAETRGLDATKVRSCVAEATDDGIVTRDAADGVWFRHPLLGEVIASTVSPAELVQIHREYVDVWEAATSVPTASRAAHLALHHAGGDHPDAAYDWSLRAADAAREVLAFAEESLHLHRACLLWADLDPATRGTESDRVALLGRASDSAMRAGEYRLALDLREEALALVDREQSPLVAARLLFQLPLLRDHCAVEQSFMDPEAMRATVSLTERVPDSAEHAIALAHLAFGEVWDDRPEAADHAEDAVRLARDLGSAEALAWALGVRSQTRWVRPEALVDADEAVELARASGDRQLLAHAAVWRCNCLESQGRFIEAADSTGAVFRELVSTGYFYEAIQSAPVVAGFLLELGRWPEARAVLREALSRRLKSRWAADMRATAADLAWREGSLAAARQHLARARELSPRLQMVGENLVHGEVHVAWALGDPETALSLAEEAIPVSRAIDPGAADELLVWAARAACDLAGQPGARAAVVARLDAVEALRRDDADWFLARGPEDRVHPARGRVYAAERARCHRDLDALPGLWRAAAEACASAELRWEEAMALYRLGECLLSTGRVRGEAAGALRAATGVAARLGAAPILADAEALARQAHISLEQPIEPVPGSTLPPAWAALTTREREVLAHLESGRTYAEIAQALFISEKTVSVHVSNLLRKTGTSSRVEVAELARRTRAVQG